MGNSLLSMPVTVEQIAVVVRRLSDDDRRRLLQLVPGLGKSVDREPSIDDPHTRSVLADLKHEILAGKSGSLLAPDEPFLDDLTLDEYLALPEIERARLWDSWSDDQVEAWGEVDAKPDAIPAR